MEETSKAHEVVGMRRMIVALVAIVVIGAVEYLNSGGIGQWGAIGIGIVTLGYFTSKFAEPITQIVKAWLQKLGVK